MNPSNPSPPSWAERLLGWTCPSRLQEEAQGDLHELYAKWEKSYGHKKAIGLYVFHALKFLRLFAQKRQRENIYPVNHSAMYKNYFKISLRHLWRHKGFSFINITGLSLGLACCMLIFLYTKDEISYDRFHEKKDRIHQLTYSFLNLDNNEVNNISSTGVSAGEGFKEEVPEIEAIVRVSESSGLTRKGAEVVREGFLYVDDNFFSIFSFPLIHGDAQKVFQGINSIVLSELEALKYFNTTDVLGKELAISLDGKDFEIFVVSAVAKNVPENSSLKFNLLLPFELYRKAHPVKTDDWMSGYLNTFLLLHPQANPQAVEAKFADVFKQYAGEKLAELSQEYKVNVQITYGMQPLTAIHLAQTFKGSNGVYDSSNPTYSYVLSVLALLILLIACFNFVNLTVAQSLERGREIGIRKTSGSDRRQIVRQFMGESFLVCLFAFSLALLLAYLVLPIFNDLANKRLSLSYLADGYLIGGYVLLLILTTLAAGSYPAWVLSGFNPIHALSGRQKLTGRHAFAKSLVVVQFVLAAFLIIGTFTIYSQINYFLSSDLGYDDNNLIRISLPEGDNRQVEMLRVELSKSPEIVDVAAKTGGFNFRGSRVDGKDLNAFDFRIDDHFVATLGISLKEGRSFSNQFPGDSSLSVIVNEAYSREAGWGQYAVGKTLAFRAEPEKKYTVVGVVNDYHFRSLHEKIDPVILHQIPGRKFGEVLVKIQAGHLPGTIALLKKAYTQVQPYYPFNYEFMDVLNARQYQTEQRWKQIMAYAAFLAISISCIGLFGLAALSIRQRMKEIGIRKVLGASMGSIVTLLSGNFLKLVLIAFIVAVPLGLYASNKWLETFAYRIELSWWIFILVGLLITMVSLLVISFQSIRAALVNPVELLRNE